MVCVIIADKKKGKRKTFSWFFTIHSRSICKGDVSNLTEEHACVPWRWSSSYLCIVSSAHACQKCQMLRHTWLLKWVLFKRPYQVILELSVRQYILDKAECYLWFKKVDFGAERKVYGVKGIGVTRRRPKFAGAWANLICILVKRAGCECIVLNGRLCWNVCD